ncbi:MAG: hypothetical protein Q7R64_04355 [bacterium]|nr:hypothetical protein [bacterium]
MEMFPNKEAKKKKRGVKRIYSPTKMKILLLLQAGVALSFAGTLSKQFRILGELADEWKGVERAYLSRIIREFYTDRLVSMTENGNGTVTAVLTEKGKKRAITFNLSCMEVRVPEVWDGLWHMVIFDIPEKYKVARYSLRDKLLALGFFQCQKSVYIHPFSCEDEVDFISNFFKVGRYVRYGVIKRITNEEELLLRFNLKKPI